MQRTLPDGLTHSHSPSHKHIDPKFLPSYSSEQHLTLVTFFSSVPFNVCQWFKFNSASPRIIKNGIPAAETPNIHHIVFKTLSRYHGTVLVVIALTASRKNAQFLCIILSFQNVCDSTAVAGSPHKCAAFPWYICKGSSYTFFYLK